MARGLASWPRRRLLRAASLAGIAGAIGLPHQTSAEPPPETTRLRLSHIPSICLAPQYAAEELLRGEGFAQVQYIGTDALRLREAGMVKAPPQKILAEGTDLRFIHELRRELRG